MFKETILEFYERDIRKLREEIAAYKDESSIWKVHEGISNSGGNLCLHLVGGSLNHFIGAILGNTGYVRNREREFTDKNLSREQLISGIDSALQTVKITLTNLKEEDISKEYPIEFGGRKVSTMYILIQMLAHVNYHLGQINYHRRLIENIS